MAYSLLIIFITVISLSHSPEGNISLHSEIKKTFSNPLFDGADPWVIKKDNYYYYCYSAGNSVYISRSEFMTRKGEIKKIWSAPVSGWNRSNIWAPELHFIDGRWYIYYAAGESGPPFIYQRTGVLESEKDDPFSDYSDRGILYTGDNPDMKSENRWAIDMTVFKYDKRLYAVWSGWIDDAITDKTPQHLFIAEMESPVAMKVVRKKISSPDQLWETGGPLNLEEGPEILTNNGNLFIVYSCRESWTVDYRLGILKLKKNSASLLSPSAWEKSGPVFMGPFGAGHCSFTKSPDGTEDWIFYHAKKNITEGWQRDIRLQQFTWKPDGYPDFGSPVETGKEIARPSGELEIEERIR